MNLRLIKPSVNICKPLSSLIFLADFCATIFLLRNLIHAVKIFYEYIFFNPYPAGAKSDLSLPPVNDNGQFSNGRWIIPFKKGLTLTMHNFMNGKSILYLSIIIFWDIKIKTESWSANSIEPGQTAWLAWLYTGGKS